ncbi:MAG: SUMF1/EgtB/PvdO family nonheme iron enzyme, partial [Bdellovibrionaceae bacterium]|nr:SUMF1/EgtB/PvdO family nonheme iron enzyme [Pseudobdellovibrionaceae bacterium]
QRTVAEVRRAFPRTAFLSHAAPSLMLSRNSADAQRRNLIRKQHVALERFVLNLQKRSKPRLEVDGDVAIVDEGQIELKRISSNGGARPSTTYVSTKPITNGQYRSFLEATNLPPPPTWTRPSYCLEYAPVVGVTWFEASAYAAWIGGNLPTESEWLQAAQGPDPGRRFATATGTIGSDLACYGRSFSNYAPEAATVHPPNAEGFYGLCGNTWDWCNSSWGAHRVIRGGGCMDAADFCAVDARYRNAPIDRDCTVGFRVKITHYSRDVVSVNQGEAK